MAAPFHRRSKRILLQVVVHIEAREADGKVSRVQAFTESVNAHGGLLDAPQRLTPGQHVTLINPSTGRQVSCRVVRVAAPSDGYYRTAFEFYAYCPEFWPVTFAPTYWGVTQEALG